MSGDPLATAAAPLFMASEDALPLYLSYGSYSLQGRRPAQSDAVATVESFSVLSPPMGLDYFAVFDGHSGTAVVEHLKKALHVAINQQIQAELDVEKPRFHSANDVAGWWKETIRKAFQAVDDEIFIRGDIARQDLDVGATALVALVLDNYMVFANCGFSKAVISRGGEAVVLTPENKGDIPDGEQKQTAESKLLEAKEQARVFGSLRYKDDRMMASPEVVAVNRELGDELLILASDGLWESVDPKKACFLVRQKLINEPWEQDRKGSPAKLAKELAERAVSRGSKDNVTVVIIILRKFW